MTIKSWGNFFKKDVIIINDGNTEHAVRGSGLSYNDSSFFSAVKFSRSEKFLIDVQKKEITVSAGVTLKEISSVLNKRGFILPVTPGTELITAGGAFASNIHGKSHHIYGCFSDNVIKIKYLNEENKIIEAFKSDDVFSSLAGSFGLLFEIVELTLSFQAVESNILSASNIKCDSISEIIACFNKTTDQMYTVAWFDSSPSDKNFGRGVFMSADIDDEEKQQDFPDVTPKRIPILPSFIMNNKLIVSLMNAIYFNFSKNKTFKVPAAEYLYPLDKYSNWDLAYGRRGMFQFQCAIEEDKFENFVIEMRSIMFQYKMVSFVSVMKKFGNVIKRSPLDFQLQNSFTIAMDFAASKQNILGAKLLNKLVSKYNGRVYLAKDSFLDATEFRSQYKDGESFLSVCEEMSKGTKLTSDLFLRIRG